MISVAEEVSELLMYDTTAERHVIAGVFLIPSQLAEVGAIVSAEDFSAVHGDVFAAILRVSANGAMPDVGTCLTDLKRFPPPNDTSWAHFLAEMFDPQLWGVNAVYHAKVVQGYAKRRKVREVIGAMHGAMSDKSVTAIESVNEVESIWRESGITDIAAGSDVIPSLSEASQAIRDHLDGRLDVHKCIATGLTDLDYALNGGVHAGSLTVIAAQSGMGKTALGLNIARKAAESGTVLYVSVEMSRVEMLERLVASESEVLYTLIRKGLVPGPSRQKIDESLAVLESLPIRMPSQKAPTVEEIGTWARRYQGGEGLALVVVDYVQILKPSHGHEKNNREQVVNHFALSLKQLASELGVPVLTMSQLNDQGEVRDSRAIEHHADFVLLAEVAEKANSEGLHEAQIRIKKGRSVEKCAVDVWWEGRFVRFMSRQGISEADNFVPAQRDF